MAVVKANAYGHTVEHCVPVLLGEGITLFGAATVEEGMRIRSLAPSARIVVLCPLQREQHALVIDADLEPMISGLEGVAELAATAVATGRQVKTHLFVDTGMTRNGVAVDQIVPLLERLVAMEGLDVIGFSSHFATSDVIDDPFARLQIERFDGALRTAIAAGHHFTDVHLANSGGVFNYPASHYTVVRPGLALYGYHPTRERQGDSRLRPVMSVLSRIGSVRRVGPGTSVSYGRTFTTARESTIATVRLGYADGVMRCLSGRLRVMIDGRDYPVVGTICMDEMMIDIGDDTNVATGSEVTLIGRCGRKVIDAWDLASLAGTIPYEICTNISARVPRLLHVPDDQRRPHTTAFEA